MSAGVTLIASAGKVAVMAHGGCAVLSQYQADKLARDLTRFSLMAEALRAEQTATFLFRSDETGDRP